MVLDGFAIQGRTLGGVGLLNLDQFYPDLLKFVLEEADEVVERNLDEVLVRDFPHFALGLPALVVANEDPSYVILHAPPHKMSRHLVEVVVDFALPLQSQKSGLTSRLHPMP